MKKILGMVLILITGLLIVGCDKTPEPTPTPPPTGSGSKPTDVTNVSTFWDKDGNGIPDWQEEEITLRYATWQYTNPDMVTIDVLLIDKFMEKYPNITVEMQIVGEDYDWDTLFIGLLEAGNLPDVFLVRRLESFLPFKILADITELFDNDPDTDYIFESVRNLGVYKNKRYSIPTFIYPYPWFVNLDLLDAAGINKPSYDWTLEQMEAIAQATTNPTKNEYGLVDASSYVRILPKGLKMKENLEEGSSWYAFSYDGDRFNFDDPVMQTGINRLMQGVEQGYIKRSFSAAELEEKYNDPAFVPTYGGKVAIWPEPTWSIKDHFDDFTFEWDAYPGPGGVTGGNTDIAGISALSKHKHAAYHLLKWMSFGEEGLLTRFELYKDFGDELYQQANNFPYPIVDYGIDGHGVNKVWSSIPYESVAPGFVSPQFIEGLRNGAIWANKETVGWDAVDEVIGPYLQEIYRGENTFAALKETIQQEADRALNNARRAMDEMLD